MNNFWRGLLAAGLCCVLTAQAAVTQVIYPLPESGGDTRYADVIALLKMALQRTPDFGPYRLAPSPLHMNKSRALSELAQGQSITIAWSSTSPQKEQMFIPIRISLRKDLLSYRLLLIRKGEQARFDTIRDLAGLRGLTIGQGMGWGDIEVYHANGISVINAGDGALLDMLAAGRFDAYPRGISQIFSEYAGPARQRAGLAIEKHLAFYYPWPYYFFVNRLQPALALRIQTGLQRMQKDGSFDRIFWKFHGAAIRRAKLASRCLIRLQNPLLAQGEDKAALKPVMSSIRSGGGACLR